MRFQLQPRHRDRAGHEPGRDADQHDAEDKEQGDHQLAPTLEIFFMTFQPVSTKIPAKASETQP